MCFVALFQKLSFLVFTITTDKQYSLKNTNMYIQYMLLIYYGSPVSAKYSVNSPVPLICLQATEKKYKCQGMSEHLKDPKNTLVLRGLNHPAIFVHSSECKIHQYICLYFCI